MKLNSIINLKILMYIQSLITRYKIEFLQFNTYSVHAVVFRQKLLQKTSLLVVGHP